MRTADLAAAVSTCGDSLLEDGELDRATHEANLCVFSEDAL